MAALASPALTPASEVATPTFRFEGYDIPIDLLNMTGVGPDDFAAISESHLFHIRRSVGIEPHHNIVEIGCGIGRDAIALTRILSPAGHYTGIDIIKPSIDWCNENISAKHQNFKFIHYDVADQLHNAGGNIQTTSINLPFEDGSVDRIFLWSVFTHLFRADIVHYLKEFRRILAPDGLVLATCFIVNDEIIASAQTTNLTPYNLRFEHLYEPGCYITNIDAPASAVAYDEASMRSMIEEAGLTLARPFQRGQWSGYYPDADGPGQDGMVLSGGYIIQPEDAALQAAQTADQMAYETKRRRAFSGMDVSAMRGLEIGPLSKPLVRRKDGPILYLDHCSRDDLLKKYEGHPHIKPSDIEFVDIIADGSHLLDLLGDRAPLDYVVASHVIEHVPDLVGWLMDIRAALRDGGTLVLVIPDKRFTFDVMRREASLEEVVAAHTEERKRPGLRCIMDHFANVVDASAWHLWEDYSQVRTLPFYHSADFLSLAATHYEEGRYIDVHSWVFTPWSFIELLGQLESKFHIGFDLEYSLTTQSHDLEFYVQLRRTDHVTTDWAAAAADAQARALWPPGHNVQPVAAVAATEIQAPKPEPVRNRLVRKLRSIYRRR
jgi:SAM-dependent methyltransferase